MSYTDEFFETFELLPAVPQGRGSGSKERVGRKSDEVRAESDYVEFAKAKARKEIALADKEEMNAAKMAGELVERRAVRDATATALATIAQTLRAIPDNLERQLGIEPEVA